MVLRLLLGVLLTVTVASNVAAQQSTRVAFGCCMDHSERQEVFDALNLADPEVFVFLGDTVDVDAGDMDDMLEAYEVLNRFRGPRLLRRQSAVMAVWNRMDYQIDGYSGANNPLKYAVRNHFLTFWREPISSPRMFQQHGIAKSVIFGDAPQRVQVILLDGRWNRDALSRVGWFERLKRSFDDNLGPYQASPGGRLLGDEQWQWLREQLQKPAEVRVLMSATPFFAPLNGYDSWAMYAQEQQRLQQLLQEVQPNGLVLAVGDRGFGELVKVDGILEYPLWQVTSGYLSAESHTPYAYNERQGKAQENARYGQIEVRWQQTPELILSLRDVDGRALLEQTLTLPN
ncbi:phosphodiesterase [Idiomarina sp. OT37-5b]|jgi:alkaline phosphatase D|uniref:alkaline phosphatase D family protein n=1 Tax=Idiomarina sp. OT37-5b TaxID=2100422 RepID=UPI000CF88737|nr:alkaline phosphatase D family protein [Idiomarina sp. OT37-5b]AVJ56566.1 phosphodiesterase [Idiomarina sp. OT37-5b]